MARVAKTRFLPMLALLCLSSAAPAVEVYRSVDANGNPSFSDRPPADAPSEQLTVRAHAPPPSSEDARRREEIRSSGQTLHDARIQRESVPGRIDASPPPQPPPTDQQDTDPEDRWMPLYYPPYGHDRHRPPWPTPPQSAPPIPRPNPDSASPRGLSERIRQTWKPEGS